MKTVNAYVSGSLKDIKTVRETQELLRENGFNITYDWTADDIVPGKEEALRQVHSIYDSDVVVLVDHPNGKGKYVEVGIAVAHDIPVVVIPHLDAGSSMFWELDGVYVFGRDDDSRIPTRTALVHLIQTAAL